MRFIKQFSLVFFISVALRDIAAQHPTGFPPPDTVLVDAKHKEPKSGVHLGPGNTITIQQGVGTPTTINVLAFSKDSKLLAAGKDFGRVVVWDVPSRKVLCAIDTGQGIVHAVALSSDGKFVATGGEGEPFALKLWQLPEGKLVRTYRHFNGYVRAVAFGPAGTWMIAADNAGVTHILDPAADKPLVELQEMHSPLLSPQGDILMTVNKDEFTLWSTSDWTKLRTLKRNPSYAIPLALSPTPDNFVITSSGNFRLLRLSNGEILPSSPSEDVR
jgi:WD40 repeat protein